MAHADSIQADRPGFSTGTYTVAPGYSHIEVGLQYDKGNNIGERGSYTAPLLNYRMGLTDETELNLLWDGWNKSNGDSSLTNGDLMLGLKQRIVTNEDYNISWLGFVTLPTGTRSNAQHFSPFIGLLWDRTITDNISLFGTLQLVSYVESRDRKNQFQPAIGLSYQHTDKLGSYVEIYSDIAMNTSVAPASVFDAGLTYLLTDSIQVDFNFGLATDRRSSDFAGFGFAIRF
ncbi:transporter [sulfur-oxidizing endosymbiont of Gigantopelta aegis]|uniref:transporter n=2 Tax=sulfur-oxidizing endosymbiont of Gigantopelta aegis TaxID=2794934 RepID=UPI0018DE9EBE|nr:transporter [sulfur-oxidizing endosymbiont of Gigantopelta aegis]